MKKLILYTDGGARGNPGPAGIGCAIYDAQNSLVETVSRYIGETTNNQAEYQALYAGLTACKQLGATEVSCMMDSELIVKQMRGEYRVKDPGLAQWYAKVQHLIAGFQKVTFTHVRREKNTAADALVNEAIDRRS